MKKCTVIAMTNQKGGVGKTTSALNLGIGLANEGKSVLLIDADSQANLTMSLGINQPDEVDFTISTVMEHVIGSMEKGYEYSISTDKNAIIHHAEGIDLLPANIELAGMEVMLNNRINRERILSEFVNAARLSYDYIIIDCMPSLGLITVNALSAADKVIIPTQAQYLSAKGIEQLLRNVAKVKRYINPHLDIAGILMTMVQKRTKMSREMIQLIAEVYGRHIKVFDTQIGLSVKAAEASDAGMSIYKYAARSNTAEQYRALTSEVVNMFEGELEKANPEKEL